MKVLILILLLTLTFGCRHDVIRIKLYHETDLQPEDYTGKVKHEWDKAENFSKFYVLLQ